MSTTIKTLVWGEFRHEKRNPKVAGIYPDGMHEAIAAFLRKEPGLVVSTAWLDQPEHGLGEEVLDSTGTRRTAMWPTWWSSV